MSMTKREKILICIVLVLAVLFVYYMYFLQPSMKDLNELNNQKNSKESTLMAYEQIKSSIEDTDKNIADLGNDITQISSNVIYRLDQPAVLVYLDDTIRKSGYANKLTYDFVEVAGIGQLNICQVNISMRCTYENLKKILKLLEDGEYFAKVVGLEARWSTQEEITGDITENTGVPEDTSVPGDTGVPESSSSTVTEPANVFIDKTITVTLTLEFYNLGGELPPDKSYPFAGGYSYDEDIFF